MKGRNTTVVSIRLPDSVYAMLKERAKDDSVSEYLKSQILRSVNTSDANPLEKAGLTMEGNTIKGVKPSVQPSVKPKKKKYYELTPEEKGVTGYDGDGNPLYEEG